LERLKGTGCANDRPSRGVAKAAFIGNRHRLGGPVLGLENLQRQACDHQNHTHRQQ
jgi:hypothetical protein